MPDCSAEQADHNNAIAILGQAGFALSEAQMAYDIALANAQATHAALQACLNGTPPGAAKKKRAAPAPKNRRK